MRRKNNPEIIVDIELKGFEEFTAGLEKAEKALASLAIVAKKTSDELGMPVGCLSFWHRLRIRAAGWMLGR